MGVAETALGLFKTHAHSLPTIPSAPIEPIRQVLSHLTSTPLHPLYPSQDVLRFGALHALRVALAWEAMKRAAKNRRLAKGEVRGQQGDETRGRVGVLGDLLGYLTAAWGGSTLVCILLASPPPWLVSSVPWLTYIPLYFIFTSTHLSSLLLSLVPSPLFTLLTSILDGLIRSTAIAGMPALIASSPSIPGSGSIWTTAILSVIAITGGGFMIDLFGLAGTGEGGAWTVGQPGLLKGGVLGTVDAWSAVVVALAHAGMVGTYHPSAASAAAAAAGAIPASGTAAAMDSIAAFSRSIMHHLLPSELLLSPTGSAIASSKLGTNAALTSPDTARAVVALLLMSIYLAKNLTLSLLSSSAPASSSAPGAAGAKKNRKKAKGGVVVKGIELDQAEKEVLEAVTHEKAENVLRKVGAKEKASASESGRSSRSATPKKAKGKSA